MEALLGGPAPEQGRGFAEVLQEFADEVMPNAFKTNHPRFLAFIPGAPNFPSILGELLCAGTNFFAGVWLEAAAPSQQADRLGPGPLRGCPVLPKDRHAHDP